MELYKIGYLVLIAVALFTVLYMVANGSAPRPESFKETCAVEGCTFSVQIQCKNAQYIGESIMDKHIDRHIVQYLTGDNKEIN